jgi:hypothetical protein
MSDHAVRYNGIASGSLSRESCSWMLFVDFLSPSRQIPHNLGLPPKSLLTLHSCSSYQLTRHYVTSVVDTVVNNIRTTNQRFTWEVRTCRERGHFWHVTEKSRSASLFRRRNRLGRLCSNVFNQAFRYVIELKVLRISDVTLFLLEENFAMRLSHFDQFFT